jgi:hypothetical protein
VDTTATNRYLERYFTNEEITRLSVLAWWQLRRELASSAVAEQALCSVTELLNYNKGRN